MREIEVKAKRVTQGYDTLVYLKNNSRAS